MEFNTLYQKYKVNIKQLCKSIENNIANPRIEYDDLFQEASLKLWQLIEKPGFKNNKSWIMIALKNHLLDYIKSFKKDALYEAESIENLKEFNPKK